jgi:Fe2+ transport system protein B
MIYMDINMDIMITKALTAIPIMLHILAVLAQFAAPFTSPMASLVLHWFEFISAIIPRGVHNNNDTMDNTM